MANAVAYGFVGKEHLFNERVTQDNVREVRDAIAASVAYHNDQVNRIMSELVETTTEHQVRFRYGNGGTLQPIDEYGNPLPVREQTITYDVAFPIDGGGTAWGDTRISRALMTVEEVNTYTIGSLRRDADWLKRHALAALFDNVEWTFPDEEFGDLVIKPLANGDATKYRRNNNTVDTDNHYLAQANAIDDANNPFAAIKAELTEHPENAGGTVVAYVPTNLVGSIEALTNFYGINDPNIRLGLGTAALDTSITPGMGDEFIGYVDGVYIVEWTMLPDNYIVAVARGAEQPVLMMRQYPVAELQGLFTEEHSPDGNLQEHRFLRFAGFGAFNRVGAVVMRIGNASYAVPAGYDAPLGV